MPTEVLMPQLGESVVEGVVGRWLIAEGEAIEEYQPLLEVETDKVTPRSQLQPVAFCSKSWCLRGRR